MGAFHGTVIISAVVRPRLSCGDIGAGRGLDFAAALARTCLGRRARPCNLARSRVVDPQRHDDIGRRDFTHASRGYSDRRSAHRCSHRDGEGSRRRCPNGARAPGNRTGYARLGAASLSWATISQRGGGITWRIRMRPRSFWDEPNRSTLFTGREALEAKLSTV